MYDLLSIMNLEVAVSKSMSRHVDRQCEKVKKGNDAYELKKCMTFSFSTLAPEIYINLCCFQHWNRGGGGPRIDWRGYRTNAPCLFVLTLRKEIEDKNVKRQVLEPLSANGSLKKSQPIRRQMRFDCLQNLEIWLLFQGLAATHNAICEWWVEFFIAA